MTRDYMIDAAGLSKSIGELAVLRDVDLRVGEGEILALLGANGAGKTTTVRILATLLTPSGGQARVAGFDVVRARREVRRRISLTGQYAAVDERLTGRENLELIARLRRLGGREARARATEMLERFDLVHAGDRRLSTYSGGMKRRLDIAASLIGDPQVVFLDEPTTGLDPRARLAAWEAIGALADSGVTILLTTQYLDEADALASRIAMLDAGRLLAQGSPRELKQRLASGRLELELVDAAAFEATLVVVGAAMARCDAARLTIEIPIRGGAEQVRVLLDRLDPDRRRIVRFSLREATLDEVFLTLTEQGADRLESELAHV